MADNKIQPKKLRRPIEGTDISTNETHHLVSKNQAGKYYKCSPALIYYICEGKNNAKLSKKKITLNL